MENGTTKVCSRCGETKSLDAYHNRALSKDGLNAACRVCRHADYIRNAAYHADRRREYYARNRDKIREQQRQDQRRSHLVSRYGISVAEWERIFTAQGRVCAICGTDQPKRTWHTDHCHDTLKIRGVLCHRCNLALGHFEDSAERVRAALAYLLSHEQAP